METVHGLQVVEAEFVISRFSVRLTRKQCVTCGSEYHFARACAGKEELQQQTRQEDTAYDAKLEPIGTLNNAT